MGRGFRGGRYGLHRQVVVPLVVGSSLVIRWLSEGVRVGVLGRVDAVGLRRVRIVRVGEGGRWGLVRGVGGSGWGPS